MRVEGDPVAANNGLFYFVADHLGGTSLTLCGNTGGCGNVPYGDKVGEMKYTPFGETRTDFPQGDLHTDRRFTGQREDSYMNLYEMGARWYSPVLGRWLSPDTIVPDPQNPQSLNRFSYVNNRPLNRGKIKVWCLP